MEKILLVILDKFMLAGIVAIFSWGLNMALEKYKTKQAFSLEIAKIRSSKIAEVWNALYEWEHIARIMVEKASELQFEENSIVQYIELLGPLEKESKDKAKNIAKIIDSSRFWLGNKQYNIFKNYHELIIKYLETYIKNDLTAFKQAEKQLNAAKEAMTITENFLG